MSSEPTMNHWKVGAAVVFVVMVSLILVVLNPVLETGAAPEAVSLDEGTSRIARSLLAEIEKAGIETVAVLELTDADGQRRLLGPLLADEISRRLTKMQSELRVVERKRLPEILGEQRLFGSGLMDTTKTVEVGKVRGADALVMGTVRIMEDAIIVNAWVSTVDTGLQVASESVRLLRPSVGDRLLGLSAPEGAMDETPVPRLQPCHDVLPQGVLDTWEEDGLRIEALKIMKEEDQQKARVDLRLTNLRDSVLLLGVETEGFGRTANFLFDEKGQGHLAVGDGRGSGIHRVGKTSERDDYLRLPPGSTVASMSFKANKDTIIHGDEFWLTARLVLHEEAGLERYLVSLENLVVQDD